jgi:hypothetical protein
MANLCATIRLPTHQARAIQMSPPERRFNIFGGS